MGVCGSHILAQGYIQKTNPAGLGGAVYKKDHEAYAYGTLSCLWVPRHKEAPMLIVNIHQAGSATPELQQQVWMALQGVRAQYPEAQGVLGGDISSPCVSCTKLSRSASTFDM